tara:strand:- start:52 stop:231 length:180 start_codon:yes stop_codon:yes gene_type:complete
MVSLEGGDFVKCFILVKVSEETSDGIRSATKWMIDATIVHAPDDALGLEIGGHGVSGHG